MSLDQKATDRPDTSRPLLGRGRPALSKNRQVCEDLLSAAEQCLLEKPPQELSTKEIAARAGTRPAMIYYYFRSKDGLLAEIVRRSVDEVLKGITAMEAAIRRDDIDNPTRAMIALLISSYNDRPAFFRILTAEAMREDSPVMKSYLQIWRSNARSMIAGMLSHLSHTGYYRKDIDIDGVVNMIRSAVFFPLIDKQNMAYLGEPVEGAFDEKWIDLVATVFDSYLRPISDRTRLQLSPS